MAAEKDSWSFSSWVATYYWSVAALTSSIIPFILLILYQRVPWAREVLDTGQDKNVFIPPLGWVGYRCRGQAYAIPCLRC